MKIQRPQTDEHLTLTLIFPMFPFDPPENIRKPLVNI